MTSRYNSMAQAWCMCLEGVTYPILDIKSKTSMSTKHYKEKQTNLISETKTPFQNFNQTSRT